MAATEPANSLTGHYIQLQKNIGKPVENELLSMFKRLEEESHLQIGDVEFTYRGNKRNSQNQIYRRRLDDDDAQVLCSLLKDQKLFVGLHLDYNGIGDEGAVALGHLLQETAHLKILSLSFNDIGPQGAESIAKGIQMNETLQVLKLDGNKIQCKGGMCIASALQVNNVLQELNLSYTDIKSVCPKNDCPFAIQRGAPCQLYCNQLKKELVIETTDCIIAFATLLTDHPSMKRIHLDRPLLFSKQEETTVHLANMLKVNERLEELHIGKHGILNFGAERLADSLHYNNSLFHLDLSGNRISRDGAYHLAKLLKQNTSLKLLNLGYNRIEDAGACYIADALSSGNFSLRVLSICFNEIGEEGLCSLAKALVLNIGIEEIYIWGNKFTTAVCKEFNALIRGPSPRISGDNTDVQPYEVDGILYLARIASPFAL